MRPNISPKKNIEYYNCPEYELIRLNKQVKQCYMLIFLLLIIIILLLYFKNLLRFKKMRKKKDNNAESRGHK